MAVTGMGSLMWEFFMETEPAAINDFIATTLSGAMLGEMLYRMSSRIIDESAIGKKRTGAFGANAAGRQSRVVSRPAADSWRTRPDADLQ